MLRRRDGAFLLFDVLTRSSCRLMLREPRSLYVAKRSSTLLKVKTFFDAEAVVIGYEPGKVSIRPEILYSRRSACSGSSTGRSSC